MPPFVFREFGEYPVGNIIAIIPSDTYFASCKSFRSEMLCDGFESVLASRTSFLAEADLSEIHVYIIRKHEDILQGDLIEIDESDDRFSGEIHIGQWFQKDDFLSSENPFGDDPFEPGVFPILETRFVMEEIDEKKPDIVSGDGIFFSRVSESDDEFHFLWNVICQTGFCFSFMRG